MQLTDRDLKKIELIDVLAKMEFKVLKFTCHSLRTKSTESNYLGFFNIYMRLPTV